MKYIFLLVSIILFQLLSSFSDFTVLESATLALGPFLLLSFIYELGKKFVILDISIIIAYFTWLVVPIYFYRNYTTQNQLAKMWVKVMPVASDEFFSFVLPGFILLAIGLKIGSNRKFIPSPALYLQRLRSQLTGQGKIGFLLIGFGILGSLVEPFIPKTIQFIFFLFSKLTYVGVLYIYFSDHASKKIIIWTVLGFAALASAAQGMFGQLLFIVILSIIIIAIDLKLSFLFKLTFFFAGAFLVLVIQSVKPDYRKKAWKTGSDTGYFADLFIDQATNPGTMFEPKKTFALALRLNQGLLIARTMYLVPRVKPFANGETIWVSLAAVVVPRILWQDKPGSGGGYNLERFWGYKMRGGTSMNIGPIGEAYGNFGTTGGIIFMFFYGLFFNLTLVLLLKKAWNRPALLCWFPFLFLFAVGVETDIMSTMNSLVKSILFMYFIHWLFKKVYKLNIF